VHVCLCVTEEDLEKGRRRVSFLFSFTKKQKSFFHLVVGVLVWMREEEDKERDRKNKRKKRGREWNTYSGAKQLKQLQAELASISSSSTSLLPQGCSVHRSQQSLFKWMALLQVHEGPFRGGLFELSIEFPFDYPVGSPVIKFVVSNTNHDNNHDDKKNAKGSDGGSPITHPNVDERTGEVSVPWTSKKSSSKSIVQALKNVRELLKYPSLDNNPAAVVPVRNERALKLWKSDRVQFDRGAYEEARQSWLSKLAKPSSCSPSCSASSSNNPSNSENSDGFLMREMVCDVMMSLTRTQQQKQQQVFSREAQHELLKNMALKEIDKHMQKRKGEEEDDSEASYPDEMNAEGQRKRDLNKDLRARWKRRASPNVSPRHCTAWQICGTLEQSCWSGSNKSSRGCMCWRHSQREEQETVNLLLDSPGPTSRAAVPVPSRVNKLLLSRAGQNTRP